MQLNESSHSGMKRSRGDALRRLGFASLFIFLSALLAAASHGADSDEASAGGAAAAISAPGKIEFVGKNLIANAEGTFHSWRIVEQNLDRADLEASYALVEVDLASIDTKNESRDDHLRTPDFFDVETFPTARVRGYGLTAIGEAESGATRYAASFDIDLHGVKKTVQGEVLLSGKEQTRIEGDLEINRVDFGIGKPANRWNPMSITETIPIHFEMELPSNG